MQQCARLHCLDTQDSCLLLSRPGHGQSPVDPYTVDGLGFGASTPRATAKVGRLAPLCGSQTVLLMLPGESGGFRGLECLFKDMEKL